MFWSWNGFGSMIDSKNKGVTKTMKEPVKIVLGLTIFAMWFTSCSDDVQYNSTMSVYMTDAPGLYHQVNVEIVEMAAHYADSAGGDIGWVELEVNAGVYNLLDFQNGLDTALVDKDDVPAGKVNQLRLILGADNSVMLLDSSIVDLKLSSQSKTGLKLNVNANLDPGKTTKVLFDFDASTSIVVQGNEELRLKPVIRVLSVE